jgi:DNA sulfur modification protein DndD
MQLLELNLKNWGPFYRDHTIELAVEPSAPVVLFHGENGRGKTSLLRAITWALYGELKEKDGRTPLPLGKLVNLDALAEGETPFGVRLKFSHNGADYVLHRSGIGLRNGTEAANVSGLMVDLLPGGGLPFPTANIPDIIDGILSHDVSDFFLFDGEMLNRFEERLREERSSTQGFVRTQVEKALGLPFIRSLGSDLDTIQDAIGASMERVLRQTKKHDSLSEKYRGKKDELDGKERDLKELRARDEDLAKKIEDLDGQLAKVDEIKGLFYERKSLEREVEAAKDTIKDYRDSLGDLAEANWWLPAAEVLLRGFEASEAAITAAEDADRERFKLQYRIGQIEQQLGSGICPTCRQPVASHNEDELRADIAKMQAELASVPAASVDEARLKRDHLRRFSSAASVLERVHEQEQDLRRERLRDDKRHQKIRQITEQISNNTVDIESLDRNLIHFKTTRSRASSMVAALEEERTKLRAEVASLGNQIAAQPEVDENERRLQKTVKEASEIVDLSYDRFRAAMRQQVSDATSDLFRRLATEEEYVGVSISEDYLLSVLDQEHRALALISSGENQILTMAFIGALAECSVEEAPMVMDTPFGRLDVGHREGILRWVSTFDTQVILFVQSGEYNTEQHAHMLGGKIGREFTIDRLSPIRSEVRSV